MKYTPGPWRISESDTFEPCIANVNVGRPKESTTVAILAEGMFKAFPVEGDANARLIAAVPEMYEALKAMISFYESENDDNSVIWNARQVIAKAEGRE